MRPAFVCCLFAFLAGCGGGNPTRVLPNDAFITTEAEVERRAQERLKVFSDQRELNWDQPMEFVGHPQLTEFGAGYDPPGERPSRLTPTQISPASP
jgi:hypothetical protein